VARAPALRATPDARWRARRERGPAGATAAQLRAMALETVAICEAGGYQAPSGRELELRERIARAVRASLLFAPDHAFAPRPPAAPRAGRITVTRETACAACRRLLAAGERIALLCFASAARPGGAFLAGRRGQEEALARASALCPALARHEAMYRQASPLGPDCLAYAPAVPFFREDAGALMEEPFLASVIAAAPVRAAQCRGRPQLEGAVRETMKRRLRRVVQLAAHYGYRVLLLGAFGCGGSGNDPQMVAQIEKEILVDEGYAQCFDVVANPIDDGFRDQNYPVFAEILGPYEDGVK
jgi:uncharacterized protein (TIGR02452 family)